MADVGVKEFKQHLSEYLDRAARGEHVLVTERGRPKALLGPLPGRARIDEEIEQGWIRPGSGDKLSPIRRVKSTGRIADSLAEDRGDVTSAGFC